MRFRKNMIKDVAVALRLSFSSHRDILAGISRYAKARHWRLQFIVPHDVEAYEKIEMRHSDALDGIITCENPDVITGYLQSQPDVPIAMILSRLPVSRVPKRPTGIILMDGNKIGESGAEHLMSHGKFRSYGFVSENHQNPKMDPVLRGFSKRIAKVGQEVEIYQGEKAAAGSEEDLIGLAAWLKNLPKPAGVMATYDLRATQVLDATRNAGISVPDQVSVIGSDNDELLCDFTSPTLTSIAPDFVKAGEMAASVLDKIMHRPGSGTPKRTVSVMSDMRIVQRESTADMTPSAAIVERALSFMRREALSGISAADVVEHLGVSRRLADMRFREATKSSILETLISLRLGNVKRLLSETSLSISAITHRSGFRNENHAKNLFRKRHGMSMRKWRAQNTPRPKDS